MRSGTGRGMSGQLRYILEQIERCGEIRDVCGTRYEKRILLAPAIKRRLIALDKRGSKYELTPRGQQYLQKKRGPSSARSASLRSGALICLAALAVAGFSVEALAPTTAPINDEPSLTSVSPSGTEAPKVGQTALGTTAVNQGRNEIVASSSPSVASPAAAPTGGIKSAAGSRKSHLANSVGHRKRRTENARYRPWRWKGQRQLTRGSPNSSSTYHDERYSTFGR